MRRVAWVVASLILTALVVLAGQKVAEEERLPNYTTATVERGNLQIAIMATGTLQAVETVDLSSQISGQISRLLVDFNDAVRRGQTLATIDPQTFEAQVRGARAAVDVARAQALVMEAGVARAEADLAGARSQLVVLDARTSSAKAQREEAEIELNRKRVLHERAAAATSQVDNAVAAYRFADGGLMAAEAELKVQEAVVISADANKRIARAELQHARAAVEEAEAALEHAEAQLARTAIRAPIDGVVINRNVDLGQTVAASLEAPVLFTIARDLRQLEVHAMVDEADIGRVRVGQRATYTVDAYPGKTFEGRVLKIRKAHKIVSNVVTYTVLLTGDNPDLLLLPGMTATARITVEEVSDALLVPNAALRYQGPEPADVSSPIQGTEQGEPGRLWRLGARGEAEAVDLRVGARGDRMTELLAGPLDEGDRVVVGFNPAAEGSGSWLRFGF